MALIVSSWHRARAFLLCIWVASWCASSNAGGGCKLIKINEWQFRPKAAQLIIEGAINGQKIGVLLDTGAQNSFVLRSAANRLGLTRESVDVALTVGGPSQVERTFIDEFRLGSATVKRWKALVVGERDLGDGVSFLLGYDFFMQADVEFDLPHNTVRIFQPEDCGQTWLAYWASSGRAGQVDLQTHEHHPGITVAVKLNGEPVLALLDTGASTSVVSKRLAAQLGITSNTAGVRVLNAAHGLGAGSVEAWSAPFESFVIGDELVRYPTIRVLDLQVRLPFVSQRPTRSVELSEMILGLDFLRSHRVLVAHSQRKLYFSYEGGQVFGVRHESSPAAVESSDRTGAPDGEQR